MLSRRLLHLGKKNDYVKLKQWVMETKLKVYGFPCFIKCICGGITVCKNEENFLSPATYCGGFSVSIINTHLEVSRLRSSFPSSLQRLVELSTQLTAASQLPCWHCRSWCHFAAWHHQWWVFFIVSRWILQIGPLAGLLCSPYIQCQYLFSSPGFSSADAKQVSDALKQEPPWLMAM